MVNADVHAADADSVRRLYAAFARRDLPAILDFLHPEVVWEEPAGLGPIAGVWQGHEAVMEALGHVPEGSRIAARAEEFLVAQDAVVVLGHHRGTSSVTGEPYAIPFAHVWSFRDGQVVRFRSFLDAGSYSHHVLGAQASGPM